ncbi:MAG TPA: prepilin peptidase [Candidatus Hydrogenedens sp.]|nr:prepilin peptidase [Candidatus Hydrogenedens sp.]
MKNLVQIDSLHIFFIIVSGMFGAVFGSFCNVCIYRFPRGESIIKPASHCPKCQNPIAWYDNIPLISWIILLGKCRHCKENISIQYPLIELITALLFVIVYLKFRFSLATVIYSFLSAGLVIVIVQDLQTWTIPDEITLTGILVGIGVSVLGMFFPEQGLRIQNPLESIDGVALGALLICLMDLIVILLMRKPGMGFGDVKLLSMLGAFLGWRGVLGSLMIGSMVGSIIGFFVILYYRYIKKIEEGEEGTEKDDANFYPIDPIASIFLGISSIYLTIRLLFSLNQNVSTTIPNEIIRGFSYLVIAFMVFSLFIALISVFIWRRQTTTDTKTNLDINEEEMEITLKAHYIPFGPYLSLGGFIFLLFGPELISKYLQILAITQQ